MKELQSSVQYFELHNPITVIITRSGGYGSTNKSRMHATPYVFCAGLLIKCQKSSDAFKEKIGLIIFYLMSMELFLYI